MAPSFFAIFLTLSSVQAENVTKTIKKLFNEEWVQEFFHVDKINKLLDDHHDGKWNNARKVYTIYCFLIWYKVYFKSEFNY